jgi:hypothetical protein
MSAPSTGILIALGVALALAAGVVLCRSVTVSEVSPHGEWDAWAIWNTRARFLFRAHESWTGAFLVDRGHPDYPLMLPLTVSRFWTYLGTDTTVVPRTVSIASAFGCVALLTSALATLRGLEQAWLGGLALLSTTAFVVRATWQVADIMLAFFVLAAVISLCIVDGRGRTRDGALVLAGTMAGLAAWTKNEGLLFALLIVASTAVHEIIRAGPRHAGARVGTLCAGLMPFAAVILFFKLSYAPANDLVEAQGLDRAIAQLADGGRYLLVAERFVQYFASVAGGFIVLLPLYVALRRGGRGEGQEWRLGAGRSTALTVLVGMVAGYYFVYILTPQDLAWHLRTSLPRLLIQLWPSMLFLIFMAAAGRREIAAQPSSF